MHVEDAEIWVHVSAPSGTRDDTLYRHQARAYLGFESGEGVKLGDVRLNCSASTVSDIQKSGPAVVSGVEVADINGSPFGDQVVGEPTGSAAAIGSTSSTGGDGSESQRSLQNHSEQDVHFIPVTTGSIKTTSAAEDGDETFDGEGYSRILLDGERQGLVTEETPRKEQTIAEKDSTLYTTPSAFLDVQEDAQTKAPSLSTQDECPQGDSWETPPSIVADSQPSFSRAYPFLAATTDSSPPWGSLPQSPLLKLGNKRRKLSSPEPLTSQMQQSSQRSPSSVPLQSSQQYQEPILPSSQEPHRSATQIYSSQPEPLPLPSSATTDVHQSSQAAPSQDLHASHSSLSQVTSSSARRSFSPQGPATLYFSLPPDSPTQPITQFAQPPPFSFPPCPPVAPGPQDPPPPSSASSLNPPEGSKPSSTPLFPSLIPSSPPLPPVSSQPQDTPCETNPPLSLPSISTTTKAVLPSPHKPQSLSSFHTPEASQASQPLEPFQSSPGIIPSSSSTTEIHPPPPPTSVSEHAPATHITPSLALLADKLDLQKRFNPIWIRRKIRPNERGYWRVCTSSWPQDLADAFWAFLQDLIGTGRAGWGVWCWRGEADIDVDSDGDGILGGDGNVGPTSLYCTSSASRPSSPTDDPVPLAPDTFPQPIPTVPSDIPQPLDQTTGATPEQEHNPLDSHSSGYHPPAKPHRIKQDIVKIYCWGEIIPHVYLVAYLASQRRIVPNFAKTRTLRLQELTGLTGSTGLPVSKEPELRGEPEEPRAPKHSQSPNEPDGLNQSEQSEQSEQLSQPSRTNDDTAPSVYPSSTAPLQTSTSLSTSTNTNTPSVPLPPVWIDAAGEIVVLMY